MNFIDKLNKAVQQNNSLLCVGLDPDQEKLPSQFDGLNQRLFEFNKAIIEATADLVCCFKPNSAFYEALGADGIEQLKLTCDYIKQNYPLVPIILDAKRGDIGNTNEKYAQFAFDYLGADGLTLQAYQGGEALEAFFSREDKGFFVWTKASSPESGEFQNLAVAGEPLYKIVTEAVVKRWNQNNNVMVVVGATYPEELAEARKIVGDAPILVPGIGAQGGDLEATLKAGLNTERRGLIINSSRGIIYASNNDDFAQATRDSAKDLQEAINLYR